MLNPANEEETPLITGIHRMRARAIGQDAELDDVPDEELAQARYTPCMSQPTGFMADEDADILFASDDDDR